MSRELVYGVMLGIFLFLLTPLATWLIKKFEFSITKSLGCFIGLFLIKLSIVTFFSIHLFKSGGNMFVFLLTFAAIFSILLLPEVVIILKILKEE